MPRRSIHTASAGRPANGATTSTGSPSSSRTRPPTKGGYRSGCSDALRIPARDGPRPQPRHGGNSARRGTSAAPEPSGSVMARAIRARPRIAPALARLGFDTESEQVRSVGTIRLLNSDQTSVVMDVQSQSFRELHGSHAGVRVDVHFPIDVASPDPKAL